MQWIQDTSKSNVDRLNTVERETSRHFRNKKKTYLKAKIDLYRGINEFKKGYQPRTYIVKDGEGDLFAESHRILARWRKCFSSPLNVLGFNDVRQTEIHTAEPLVSDPSASEFKLAIGKLKSHK
jgi:hypothetical protein